MKKLLILILLFSQIAMGQVQNIATGVKSSFTNVQVTAQAGTGNRVVIYDNLGNAVRSSIDPASILTAIPTLSQVTQAGNKTYDSYIDVPRAVGSPYFTRYDADYIYSASGTHSIVALPITGGVDPAHNLHGFTFNTHGDTSGLVIFRADNLRTNQTFYFPNASGVVPLKVKANGTTYAADPSTGTVDIGSVSPGIGYGYFTTNGTGGSYVLSTYRFYELPPITNTADNILSLPPHTYYTPVAGDEFWFFNRNTNATYHYYFSSSVTKPDGTTVTTLTNGQTYHIVYNGTSWMLF